MQIHIKSMLHSDAGEQIYPLETEEDFDRLFDDFPALEGSLACSNDWRVIIDDMVHYLNAHHLDAWLSA